MSRDHAEGGHGPHGGSRDHTGGPAPLRPFIMLRLSPGRRPAPPAQCGFGLSPRLTLRCVDPDGKKPRMARHCRALARKQCEGQPRLPRPEFIIQPHAGKTTRHRVAPRPEYMARICVPVADGVVGVCRGSNKLFPVEGETFQYTCAGSWPLPARAVAVPRLQFYEKPKARAVAV